jgi:hypothetical protein
MHPDPEIVEVEQRLARRRTQLEHTLHETGQRAVKTLASPAVLVGVVALGFLAGAGISRRKAPVKERRREKAEKTGFAGMLMTGALWLLKQQLGNPAQIAQLILSRVKHKSAAYTPPPAPRSSPGDRFGPRSVNPPPHAYR